MALTRKNTIFIKIILAITSLIVLIIISWVYLSGGPRVVWDSTMETMREIVQHDDEKSQQIYKEFEKLIVQHKSTGEIIKFVSDNISSVDKKTADNMLIKTIEVFKNSSDQMFYRDKLSAFTNPGKIDKDLFNIFIGENLEEQGEVDINSGNVEVLSKKIKNVATYNLIQEIAKNGYRIYCQNCEGNDFKMSIIEDYEVLSHLSDYASPEVVKYIDILTQQEYITIKQVSVPYEYAQIVYESEGLVKDYPSFSKTYNIESFINKYKLYYFVGRNSELIKGTSCLDDQGNDISQYNKESYIKSYEETAEQYGDSKLGSQTQEFIGILDRNNNDFKSKEVLKFLSKVFRDLDPSGEKAIEIAKKTLGLSESAYKFEFGGVDYFDNVLYHGVSYYMGENSNNSHVCYVDIAKKKVIDALQMGG